MPSANELIADLQIRHSVGVQRLGSSILRRIIPILNRSDVEIVERLLARGAVLEGTFTSKRLVALLDTVRDINHRAAVELERELRGELRDLAAYEAEFQARLLRSSVVGVRLDIVAPSAESLQAVVTSRPFQGRLLREWVEGLEQSRYVRLRDTIRLGMVQGETVDQIVTRVRGTRAAGYADGVMAISRRGAETLVRTAVNHTANATRETLYQKNDDLIAGVQWVATLDTRTCPSCQAEDGKVFDMGKGPRPPMHLGCRCATVPVLKSWRALGIPADEIPGSTRASMDGQVAESLTYGEWLSRQPAGVQDDALGPTRAALFREGGLTVDRFVNRNGDQLTLDQLREREAGAFDRAGL